MIKAWDMVVAYIQSLLEQSNSFLELLCILVGKTLAMVKFSVIWHQFDCIIEILMGLLPSLEGQISVAPVEESSSVIGVQAKSFIVLGQTLLIQIIVIKSKRLIIIVGSFAGVQLYSFLEPLQSLVVILVLKIRKAEVVLSRSVIFDGLAGSLQVINALCVLLDLPVAVATMD